MDYLTTQLINQDKLIKQLEAGLFTQSEDEKQFKLTLAHAHYNALQARFNEQNITN